MKRRIKVILVTLGVLVVIIQFIPVDRSNPPVQAVVAAPPAVYDVLERACFDCHSNETEWPWYSYVAPVSWLIAGDVHEAREDMNFTEWNTIAPREQAKLIKECWEEVEEGEMPLPKYVRLHPEARLSDAEKALIRDWAALAGGETMDEDEADELPVDME